MTGARWEVVKKDPPHTWHGEEDDPWDLKPFKEVAIRMIMN